MWKPKDEEGNEEREQKTEPQSDSIDVNVIPRPLQARTRKAKRFPLLAKWYPGYGHGDAKKSDGVAKKKKNNKQKKQSSKKSQEDVEDEEESQASRSHLITMAKRLVLGNFIGYR